MKCYRPKKFTSPILATIYGPSHDLSIVLAAFMHLSAEAIEWLKKPRGDGILERLIAYMAEISRIAAAVDNTDAFDPEAFQSLLNNTLDVELGAPDLDIKTNHGILVEPPLYTRGELKTKISQTNVLFGSAHRISSLKDATLRILLWLLLSFTHPLICICRGSVEMQMPSRTQITKRPLEDKANRLAAF